MRVLALDIAAKTGWAFGEHMPDASGVKAFPTAQGLGVFAAEFEDWLLETIQRFQPDLIAVESPIPVRGTTKLEIQLRAYGAHALTAKTCQRSGIPLLLVDVGRWRKRFFGVARAPAKIDGQKPSAYRRRKWLKQTCIDECERRGWPVKGDDEADAIGVLAFAIEQGEANGCATQRQGSRGDHRVS